MGQALANVESTEILGFVEEKISLKDAANLSNLFTILALRVAKMIRHNFPIQGKMVAVDCDILEVNLGSYHGMQEKVTFKVRKAIETASGFFKPGNDLIGTAVAIQVG